MNHRSVRMYVNMLAVTDRVCRNAEVVGLIPGRAITYFSHLLIIHDACIYV